MQYTDEQMQEWWDKLDEQDRLDIFATMIDKMEFNEFAYILLDQYERGFKFSPKQLASIRKWHHN